MLIKKMLVAGLLLLMAVSAASAQDEDTLTLCIRGGHVSIVTTTEDCDYALHLITALSSWREAVEALQYEAVITTPDLSLPVPNLNNIAQLSTYSAQASASGGGVGVTITQQGGGQTTITISSGESTLTTLLEGSDGS